MPLPLLPLICLLGGWLVYWLVGMPLHFWQPDTGWRLWSPRPAALGVTAYAWVVLVLGASVVVELRQRAQPARPGTVLVAATVALCGGLALLPFAPLSVLADLHGEAWSFDDSVYRLLKPGILWAALGLVAGLGGYGDTARRWALAGLAAYAVMIPLGAAIFDWYDTVEMLALVPGVVAGAWLGERVAAASAVSGRVGKAENRDARHDAQAAERSENRVGGHDLTRGERLDTVGRDTRPNAKRATPGEGVGTVAVRATLGENVGTVVSAHGGGRVNREGENADAASDFVDHADAESADPRLHQRRRRHASRPASAQTVRVSWSLAGSVLALPLLLMLAYTLAGFPLLAWALAIGLALYAITLVWKPGAALVVIPAALPLLDLAPWSGRFFWDEFDLLMLTTLAVWFACGRFRSLRVGGAGLLIAAVVLAATVSLLLGLLPWPALDANAFSTYWSRFNALRVGKGVLWGLVFFALYRSAGERAFSRLGLGAALGVAGVALWALWEHALFASGAAAADYRTTAGFSSMHTGGGHFEAYLVLALPFVWGALFADKARSGAGVDAGRMLARLAYGAVFVLGSYAMLLTVARGGLLALAAALVVLLAGGWLARRARAGQDTGNDPTARAAKPNAARPNKAQPLWGWALVGLTGVAVVVGASGAFWQARLAQTGDDANIRWNHWADTLALRGDGVAATLFGMGLGTLPAAHILAAPPDRAGSYRYANEGGNTWLALNSGGTLYLAQRVAIPQHTPLTLAVRLRAASASAASPGVAGAPPAFNASLCEKNLFNSRACRWLALPAPGRDWTTVMQRVDSGELGEGGRPLAFTLYNPAHGSVVDIDDVSLTDPAGRDYLKNGDFAAGGDRWFFNSGEHLLWHAKNLWVHTLFEQGWVGLALLALLAWIAFWRLARATLAGDAAASVWLAALTALGVMAVVDSLVDAPRLALLTYGVLFVGSTWGAGGRLSGTTRSPVESGASRQGSRRRRSHREPALPDARLQSAIHQPTTPTPE